MTALTLYLTDQASTIITSTACQLVNASGAPSLNIASTKIGTSTGYGEIYSIGNTNAWAASGSIGNPSNGQNGWNYDTSLSGSATLPGNWTPTLRLNVSNGSIVADIHVRAFYYHLVTNFTQIGSDMLLSAQTITTTATNYVFSATSFPVAPINIYIYVDIWLNITSNSTGVGTATIKLTDSASTIGYTNAQIVTPGYSVTTSATKDGSNRFKQIGSKKQDGKTRFLLYKGLNAASRFKAQGQRYKFGMTRFANAALSPSHDALVRFILLSASRQKDGSVRFKQVSPLITRIANTRSAPRSVTTIGTYMTSIASTQLTTADKLINTSGSPSLINKNSLIGTATGYGEVCSQGTSQVWYGGSQQPLPSGSGYIYESTSFENNVFVPGAWSANLRLNTSIGSIFADIHVRVFQKSGSTYTLIIDMQASAQTLTTSIKTISLSASTTIPSNLFKTGDKLYTDILAFLSTNSTNSGTATLKTSVANSSTVGSTLSEVITSGYSAPGATSRNGSVRFALSNTRQKDAKSRFRLSVSRLLYGASRFKAAGQKYKFGASRFKQSATSSGRDSTNRFRLSSVTQYQNAITRLATQGQQYKLGINRFRLSSVTQYKNAAMRFLSRVAKQRDGQARFLQRTPTQYRDAGTRFKALLPRYRDGVSRFNQVSGTIYKSAVSRFKQSGSALKNAASRFKLSGSLQKNGITRFKQSIPKKVDGSARLKAQGQQYKFGVSRFRLNSPLRYQDAYSRFRQSVPVLRNGILRFRQSVPVLKNAITRFRMISPTIYRMSGTRFRQSVPMLRDAITRFRQSVPVLKNANTRLRQSANQKLNSSTRLRVSSKILRNGTMRLLVQLQKNAATRFGLSMPKTSSWVTKLRTRSALSLSFSVLLRQRVSIVRSAVTRLRLSRITSKNATCRLQTYHFNPRDGRIRFALHPSTVSPISSATTEIVFRDGTVEMVFRS